MKNRPKSDFVTSRLRLRNYDYSLPGDYFITMVTTDRLCLFGKADGSGRHLSDAGEVIATIWASIPSRYPLVGLDAWAVMPNHLHAIPSVPPTASGDPYPDAPSISTVIQWFKTQST